MADDLVAQLSNAGEDPLKPLRCTIERLVVAKQLALPVHREPDRVQLDTIWTGSPLNGVWRLWRSLGVWDRSGVAASMEPSARPMWVRARGLLRVGAGSLASSGCHHQHRSNWTTSGDVVRSTRPGSGGPARERKGTARRVLRSLCVPFLASIHKSPRYRSCELQQLRGFHPYLLAFAKHEPQSGRLVVHGSLAGDCWVDARFAGGGVS